MKKLIKFLTVLTVIFVLLLAAVVITLKLMFPAEKLKSMAQQYAQNTLHREVTFSDVSFNWIGLTLDNLAISEQNTFAEGTFLKTEQAVLKLAVKPLLQKRLEIRTIGLEGLEINIIKRKDGTFNFDDLLPAEQSPENTAPAQTDQSSSSNIIFTAEQIYASDCSLYYQDLQQGMSTSITNLNLNILDFDLTHPFTAALSFTTDYKDKAGMDITIPLQAMALVNLANLEMPKASLFLTNLQMSYKTLKFSAGGKLENFEKPSIDLQGKLTGLSNTVIADIVPDLPHFVLPDINFTVQATSDLETSSAVITLAKLSVADSAITAEGKTAWGGSTTTYDIKSTLNLNLTQITTMTTVLDGYGMGGKLSGNLTATDKKKGTDVKGNLQLKNLAVKYDTLSLSDVNGTLKITSLDQLSADNITGKLNNESFTSSFAYKDLGSVLDIVFNFDLSKLTLSAFPSSGKEENQTTPQTETVSNETETLFNVTSQIKIGEISIPYFESKGVDLTAKLQKASTSMKQANGTVNFVLQEGVIKDLGNFMEGNKIVKIIMLPISLVNTVGSKLGVEIFPAATAREKGKISFTSGSGSYVFTDGLMNVEETHFDSSVSNMTATGNINFPTEALDMRVKATVLTSQTPVVIKIGGTIPNPSGKLDVTKTAVSLVGGILNYKTPLKAASATTNAATDITKNAADTGADAAKTTINTTVDAVKAIGGLFKKKKTEEKEEEQQPNE